MQWEMERGYLLTALVLAGVALGTGVVSANEAPLANAGLDQEVRQGTTVYLDAGGSVDPDGEIESYRWRIVAPNGSTVTPDCPTCIQTQFRPTQDGTYEVTLTATDDAGISRSDTLVVTVTESDPPSVTISGPSSATTDGSYTYRASVIAGDSPVARVEWRRDGELVQTRHISGEETTVTRGESFDDGGESTLAVTAIDAAGQTARTEYAVTVQNTTTGSSNNSDSSATEKGSSTSGRTTAATGGSGFYKEIERFSTNDGTVFAFNFLNDDQIASNKGAGNELGSDAGGMGVRKDALQDLSQTNSDVSLTDGGYGETTFEISGNVAQNFIDNQDTTYSGTRVGTTDIITKNELIGSEGSSGNKSQKDITENQPTDGTSGDDANQNHSGNASSDDSPGSSESGSSNVDTKDSGANSSPTYSYDSGDSQVEDSYGNCVGWGCGSPGGSSSGSDSDYSGGSSSSSTSKGIDDSSGDTMSDSSISSTEPSSCGPGEAWYDSLGCW